VVGGAAVILMFLIGAARSNTERVVIAGISLVICGLASFAGCNAVPLSRSDDRRARELDETASIKAWARGCRRRAKPWTGAGAGDWLPLDVHVHV
jgi:hypothetical protein